MSHIVIFQAFYNTDHIKKSFESLQMDDVDYFIIENKSKHSEEIEDYFKTKRLKGYTQFEENIGTNAIRIIVKDYWDLFKQYDYITITDGDVYVYDTKSSFEELKKGFEQSNVLVSSIQLFMDNVPDNPNRLIGIGHYENKQRDRTNVVLGNQKGGGTMHLLTFTKNSIETVKSLFFDNTPKGYLDWLIFEEINKQGYGVVTLKNHAYHLNWDLLNREPETEYSEFRRLNSGTNFFEDRLISPYKNCL